MISIEKVIELDDGGKFMYFGLESALKGESPGLVYKNADLIQFASLYRRRPRCVTPRMRKNVDAASIYYNFRNFHK